MTDGIIQQVFGKKMKLLASDIENRLMLYELQQELIEKIKHICDKQLDEQEEYPDMIDRFTLIGDNQE